MRYLLLLIALPIMSLQTASAQKFLTKNGHIRFFSEAPMENIEADNRQVTSILDAASGDVVFSLLMKSFHFEKALMEEHFNEKYVHSDKYPKSTFKGRLEGFSAEDIREGEWTEFTATGTLELHGIQKEITVTARLKRSGDRLVAEAVFPLTLADFDIDIPGVVSKNIAEVVEVTVRMDYEPYQP